MIDSLNGMIEMDSSIEDTKLQNILGKQRKHWANVVSELMDGEKKTHWCWYFLPNIPGLGKSEKAQYYAVTAKELSRYMKNSEYRGNICTVIYLIDRAYRESATMDLAEILGEVDALKFRSCITLLWYYYLHVENLDGLSLKFNQIIKYGNDVYGHCEYTAKKLWGDI